MSEVPYTLCAHCALDPSLARFIRDKGTIGTCTLCQTIQPRVVDGHVVSNVFKAVVRFHYPEWKYNDHWGMESLADLLRRPNPLIRTEGVPSLEAEHRYEFDFGVYLDDLTSPVYPASMDAGVYLFWGFSDGVRGMYSETLQDAKSADLEKLRRSLQHTNYYAFEDEWLGRLKPSASTFTSRVAADQPFFRARLGCRDEALRMDQDRGLYDPLRRVFFPHIGDDLGAPKQSATLGQRLNRPNISYLYLANTLDTAIAEVRPHPGHTVSIGQFLSQRDLEIADLTSIELLPFTDNEANLENFILLRNIERSFSDPVTPDDRAGYLLTQFLADIFRRMGFGGIKYRSSITTGTNLVVFDPLSFSYIPGSAEVRTIISLAYNTDTPLFEQQRSTIQGVEYFATHRNG